MVKTGWAPALALAGAAVIISGCTGSRVGFLDTRPAPLTPAPSGTVTSNQLPPPAQPQVSGSTAFPDAPGAGLEGQTDVAGTDTTTDVTDPSASGTSVTQVASAEPVTKEALVGAWQVSTAGSSCQMFMALTQWTGGFRAASRGCPGDAANVSAWNVSGNQVVLSDGSGNRVATLFSSGSNRFDGQTTSGRAISLSR